MIGPKSTMVGYQSVDIVISITRYHHQISSPDITSPDAILRTPAVVIQISPLATAPTLLTCHNWLPGIMTTTLLLRFLLNVQTSFDIVKSQLKMKTCTHVELVLQRWHIHSPDICHG